MGLLLILFIITPLLFMGWFVCWFIYLVITDMFGKKEDEPEPPEHQLCYHCFYPIKDKSHVSRHIAGVHEWCERDY